MSRSGYNDYDSWDGGNWPTICWRGAVTSAIKGKRGQAFLKEMLAALDALPEKKLVSGELQVSDGAVCAIGAVGKQRGVDMSKLDPEDYSTVADTFGIAGALAREIVWENDDYYKPETDEERFIRMRAWVASQIKKEDSIQ